MTYTERLTGGATVEATQPTATIRESEPDTALLIQHLIDNALNIVAIDEAVAVAVAQRPTITGDGQTRCVVGTDVAHIADTVAIRVGLVGIGRVGRNHPRSAGDPSILLAAIPSSAKTCSP